MIAFVDQGKHPLKMYAYLELGIGAIAFDKDAPDHPLVLEIDPHSPRSEAFRALRTNLLYINPDEPARTLLITSTMPGEGKSTTSVNLALTMAETGATVCA